MKLKISENIKNLRRNKKLTQEEFAELLGVSPQAVSRWENGNCYPDLEFLPLIASFFEISVDKLIGVDDSYESEKVNEYKAEFRKAVSVGDIYKCIDISRQGVAEFPNNYEMLNQLMYALFLSTDDDGFIPEWKENMAKFDEEITKLGERIMKCCPDQQIRLEATERLAFHHCEMGRKEIGRAIYETLPSRSFSKECCVWWALEENEKLPYLRNDVRYHYDILINQLWRMLFCDDLLNEVKIEISKILEALFVLFDDNIIKDWAQARILCDISKPYFKAGNTEKGFDCLAKSVEYAETFENRPETAEYNHFLFGKIGVRRDDFETSDQRPLKIIMRDKWLSDSGFDCVRDTEEFKKIISTLE